MGRNNVVGKADDAIGRRRPERRTLVLLGACLALAASLVAVAPPRPAAALPSGFQDQLVASISQPMDIDWTPDGRTLVLTKPGVVRVFSGGTLLPTPALNLGSKVCQLIEQGAQGLAVHPDFASNGFVYLYYTFPKYGPCDDVEPVNRLSRFVLSASNVIDPASELVLMDTPQLEPGGHHMGGDIEFGPDGYIYVTIGEANLRRHAQDVGRLQGKIVRFTDDGDIPPGGNAFTGPGTARCNVDGVPPAGSPAGTKCQEIYALGLRNPFRLVPDPTSPTPRFLINDVGANEWEEIDVLTGPGANYGWGNREGPCSFTNPTNCTPDPTYTDPIHWYGHQGIGGAITGGVIVPPGVWPSAYDGKVLFGDYVFGEIYQLDPGGPDCRLCSPPTSPYLQSVFASAPQVVEMSFGPHGSTQALYYLTRASGGQVRRISYVGSGNRTPTAVATASPTSGLLPLTVDFDGSQSSDPDGDDLAYEWDFGDGSPHSTDPSPTHEFTTAGTYFVELTVDDGNGGTSTATVRVDPGNQAPLAPQITSPAPAYQFVVGEEITLHGVGTDPEDGPLPDSAFTWEVRQHHNGSHWHPYLAPTTGNDLTIVAPAPEDFASTGTGSYLEVLLTATDAGGVSTTTSHELHPRRVPVTFETVPAGFDLVVAGQTVTTPATVTGWQGWEVSIGAPDQDDGSGVAHSWVSWSDGGALVHDLTIPAAPATVTATFAPGSGVVATPGAVGVTEGNSGTTLVQVPITLNKPSPTPVTVEWTTLDVPGEPAFASSGSDYVAASGVVTFTPGQTERHVTITVKGDVTYEPPAAFGGEWGLVSFSNISPNAQLETSFFGLGVFIIVEDDPIPVATPGAAGVVEGHTGSVLLDVPITLSNPSSQEITIDWATTDVPESPTIAHPGSDFVAASGTVTFAPGETVRHVTIEVLGDTVPEEALLYGEWVLVAFSNPTNATLDLSFFGVGIGVIIDDD